MSIVLLFGIFIILPFFDGTIKYIAQASAKPHAPIPTMCAIGMAVLISRVIGRSSLLLFFKIKVEV